MADVTVSSKREGWNGSLKRVVYKLSSTPATAQTYDTNMDATDGRGAEFKEIFSVVFRTPSSQQIDTSQISGVTPCTWSNSTGIITLGSVTPAVASGYLIVEGE